MARCEQGYLCDVCGQDVAEITDSDLYLGYILGLIEPRDLFHARERHIRCNPVQAQFIVDERFAPVVVEGPFDKRLQDPDAAREQVDRVTRGWRRLQEVAGSGIPITEYQLPEVRERLAARRTLHLAPEGGVEPAECPSSKSE
jgi:hypothetical protein